MKYGSARTTRSTSPAAGRGERRVPASDDRHEELTLRLYPHVRVDFSSGASDRDLRRFQLEHSAVSQRGLTRISPAAIIHTVTFEDRTRAGSFGDDAAQYDRARPGYPSKLFDDLLPDGDCTAIDVGCGTGIVARLLVERGCTVIGIERDPRMAEIAKMSGLSVEISTFEQWDTRGRLFDVLTAGQSWHWVNAAQGAAKAAAVLRSGGPFGIFWNGLQHDEAVAAGFRRIYSRLAPHLLEDSVALGTTRRSGEPGEPDEPAFAQANAFARLERRAYKWQRSYTTKAWLDELPTHSDHRTLPPLLVAAVLEAVGELIDALGGEIVVDYTTAGLFGTRHS